MVKRKTLHRDVRGLSISVTFAPLKRSAKPTNY
nr:MAG TPA: hypothetical protein [Caudoviricetes sp.]